MKEYVINNYKKYSNDLKEKYKNYLLISKDTKKAKKAFLCKYQPSTNTKKN